MAELFREVGQRLIRNIGSKELAGLDLALKDKKKTPVVLIKFIISAKQQAQFC